MVALHSSHTDVCFPNIDDVRRAACRITGHATHTPLVRSASLSTPTRTVRLKLETLQPTGAFKIRGATNAILALDADARQRGVVCASTGNHGRALTYGAIQAGTRATVCLSALVPQNKIDAIRALGGEVVVTGQSQDDAQDEVDRLVREQGMVEIPPFDHFDVIAGQGTIGLELHQDWPDIDTVVVPLSGGGLTAGLAMALKALNPNVRVIGASMERGAAMHASLNAGHPVNVHEEETLADSLGGGIGLENRYTFAMVRDLVDDVVCVNEDAIARAMRHLALMEGLITEGAGAVPIAALQDDMITGNNIALIVSGRNVSQHTLSRILSHHQGGKDTR